MKCTANRCRAGRKPAVSCAVVQRDHVLIRFPVRRLQILLLRGHRSAHRKDDLGAVTGDVHILDVIEAALRRRAGDARRDVDLRATVVVGIIDTDPPLAKNARRKPQIVLWSPACDRCASRIRYRSRWSASPPAENSRSLPSRRRRWCCRPTALQRRASAATITNSRHDCRSHGVLCDIFGPRAANHFTVISPWIGVCYCKLSRYETRRAARKTVRWVLFGAIKCALMSQLFMAASIALLT